MEYLVKEVMLTGGPAVSAVLFAILLWRVYQLEKLLRDGVINKISDHSDRITAIETHCKDVVCRYPKLGTE